MRKRTKAREYALQMLYQVDILRSDAPHVVEQFWKGQSASEDIRTFAEQLVRGATEHREEIDPMISKFANNWTIKRMGMVDRNVLRLGTYELLFLEEVPPKVSINEAVELAKRFGDSESGKFINGILDAIHKSIEQRGGPAQTPAPRPDHHPDTQERNPEP